MSKSLDHPSRS